MNAANTIVILLTPFHLTNNFLLFFSQLCFLHFCVLLPCKFEPLFTESDIVTAVANTPITMLHIGKIIHLYYTTNHLFSQSKNAPVTLEHLCCVALLHYLKHLLRQRLLILLFNLCLCFTEVLHSFQFFLGIIKSNMRVHIHRD